MSDFVPRLDASALRLHWNLGVPHRSLSWALQGSGYRSVKDVIWLQVKNADLPHDVCPKALIRDRVAEPDALVFLTSAYLETFREASAFAEGVVAQVIATVGLGNALRAGDPALPLSTSRTINLACRVNVNLSEAAMLEALCIMTEAKAAALGDTGIISVLSGALATGTGTDCQAMLAAIEGDVLDYAGKHTVVGSLIGKATYEALRLGITAWQNISRAR